MATKPPNIPIEGNANDAPHRERARDSVNSPVSDSEDAIRNLKATQSVEAAFSSVGMPSPPNDIAAIIVNHVKGMTRTLPFDQISNMSPGTGALNAAATAAVNQFVGMLNPTQLKAAQQGKNELSPREMLVLRGALDRILSTGSKDNASEGGEVSSYARHQAEVQAQAYALAGKLGLGWARENPDLLRLGPAAIQALADVHLKQDSYQRFKDGGLTAKTIVDGARYAKHDGVDMNEASKAYRDVQSGLSPDDQKLHNRALTQFYGVTGKPDGCKPDEETAAKKTFNRSLDDLKIRNPAAKSRIEREQILLKTVKKEDLAATATKDAKAVVKAAEAAKNDDLLASLNAAPEANPAPVKPTAKPAAKLASAAVLKPGGAG